MVRAKVRKELYWHKLAKVLLEHGLMPKHCAEAIKRVYPEAEVTGRHIGAFKRRLILDNMLEKNLPKTITPNEAFCLIEAMVGADDKFIYQCAVGSAKRSMKCFEYKLTDMTIDEMEEVERWITDIQV